jgi:ribulose-phosphate 3-epimerase
MYSSAIIEKMNTTILAPSLLSADFTELGKSIRQIEQNGGAAVHIDVMDGRFVPQITFGQPVVASLRTLTALPFDIHLMVEHPEDQTDTFAAAGADWITFHLESTVHVNRLISHIHQLGKKAGIAIVPSTPVSLLQEILPDVDIVLVMAVNPGFGGQQLLPFCVDKIAELVRVRTERGLCFRISVDGGVNNRTLAQVVRAGTDIVVSGSAFFKGTLGWESVR